MPHSDIYYTKLRWLLTIAGLCLYVVDIWTDVGLAINYYNQKNFTWMALTLVFVLAGLLVTQIFSYAWYRDDMRDGVVNSEDQSTISGMSNSALAFVHVFGMGVFTRYYQLLKKGFAALWIAIPCTPEEQRQVHQSLFGLATDLSMLKMFETFLESVPQLLLQLYIMLGHDEPSIMQYLSMALSFFNTAWALVDYQRCLRRSHIKEMPSGLPMAVYFMYKLCTITSHILSCCLLLILSSYSSVGLAVLWLVCTTWTHFLQTNFCSHKSLEWLYRAVTGLILVCTFFNVKGQDTKVAMTIYYSFYTVVNVGAPILLGLLKPLDTVTFFFPMCGVIYGGTLLGLVCLVAYYTLFQHSTLKSREAEEVDGLGQEAGATWRINRFLQP